MPEERTSWVIVVIEKSPQQRIRLGPMERSLAHEIKRVLYPHKGATLVDVDVDEGSD